MIEPKESIIHKYYLKEQGRIIDKHATAMKKYKASTPVGKLIHKFVKDVNALISDKRGFISDENYFFDIVFDNVEGAKDTRDELITKRENELEALRTKCRLVTDLAKTTTSYEQFRALLDEFDILDKYLSEDK